MSPMAWNECTRPLECATINEDDFPEKMITKYVLSIIVLRRPVQFKIMQRTF